MTNSEEQGHGGPVRVTATVSGFVQGVGFRWSTMSVAQSLGLVGRAENLYSGDVKVVAEGPRAGCEQLLAWLRGEAKGRVRLPGRVTGVNASWGSATGEYRSFDAY